VQVTVNREGNTKPITFDIIRDAIARPSVPEAIWLKPGIAYINVTQFGENTSKEFEEQFRKLGENNIKGLVLDLRGNPGGLLGQAVSVVSLFLRPGASVVSLAGAHTPLHILYAKGGSASAIPLAVLVDGGSASASEVVAGALKDHGRATVVGESTYGKSLVQEIVSLPSGAALKLTVARYLTPAGVDISRNGVQPDIRSRHALDAALRLLTSRR
jgi:carboxyl-terminal processing protease